MIRNVIDTFRTMTRAVNQKSVLKKKNQTETSTCHCLILEKLICQSCLLRLRHFAAQCSRSLHNKQQEDEQVAAKKRLSLPVYARRRDSLMTSNNASFE